MGIKEKQFQYMRSLDLAVRIREHLKGYSSKSPGFLVDGITGKLLDLKAEVETEAVQLQIELGEDCPKEDAALWEKMK